MEETKIKQDIVTRLLMERLYDCLQVNSKNEIVFEKYELTSKELIFLMKEYDTERFEAYCNFLKGTKQIDIEEA